jgi:MFS family permease
MRTRYPAGISRNTVLLAFASLFADISSEMPYPILPIFLTQVLHASGSVVGVVEGIAEATQNVVQGFSGWLSDKLQKRKGFSGFATSVLRVIREQVCSAVFVLRGLGSIGKDRSAELPQLPAKHCD